MIRKVVFFSLVFLCFFKSFSQENGVNFILFIDDEIVTNFIEINFNTDNEKFIYQYGVGKKINLPSRLVNNGNIRLNFKIDKFFNGKVTRYSYNTEFKTGWINNTYFLIIRIYNLDKDKYKQMFCDSEGDYVIEVENSVYQMNLIRCKS